MFIEDYSYDLVGGRPDLSKVAVVMRDINRLDLDNIVHSYKLREPVRIARQDKTFANYCANDDSVAHKTFSFGELWEFKHLKIVKVIYNKPATIVFWSDNTKTVVVCDKKDKYDPEKGFFIACTKKLFGNDFKAGGKINKALELAVDVSKKEK